MSSTTVRALALVDQFTEPLSRERGQRGPCYRRERQVADQRS